MAARPKILYLLFDGYVDTVIDSQVLTHLRACREDLGVDFELWMYCCNEQTYQHSLAKIDQAKERSGGPVEIMRGVRPAYPGSRTINRRRFTQALAKSRSKFDIVHARTDYAAAVAGPVAHRHGAKMIWDCRGDAIAEFDDAQRGRHLLLRPLVNWRRRALVADRRVAGTTTDHAFFVSESLHQHNRALIGDTPVSIVPCVAHSKDFYYSPRLRNRMRAQLGLDATTKMFVYSGSLARYQCFPETVHLFDSIHRQAPNTHLLVLTPYVEQARPWLDGMAETSFTIVSAPHKSLNDYLNAADMALMLRADTPTNRVASPTKFAEYCLAGLPVIMTNAVIGSAQIARDLGNMVAPTVEGVLAHQAGDRADLAVAAQARLDRAHFLPVYGNVYRGFSAGAL